MNYKVNFLYIKYRNTRLNNEMIKKIKRKFKLTYDETVIFTNKIRDYQLYYLGDALHQGDDFYCDKEDFLVKWRNAKQRERARRRYFNSL